MHLYIDVYVPFIMLWRQKASSARSQEDPGYKAAAPGGTVRAHDGITWTRDTAGHGSKQSCHHQEPAPSCSEGFTTNMLSKRSFSLLPRRFVPGTHSCEWTGVMHSA